MDWTITPAEMKALEADYMAETDMPGALLMEHAAQGICAALKRHASPNATVLFLCGPGSNGGDGYAAARLWQSSGGHSLVWELTDHPRGDAGLNRRLAQACGIPLHPVDATPAALPPCAAVVDALFGTGLDRPIQGVAVSLIRLANASKLPIIAVDIPSGLDGATGRRLGEAIRATETVTFHRIKSGLLLAEGPACTGQLTVHPILIPAAYGHAQGMACLSSADISRLMPPRPVCAHKGDLGRVVIWAGSLGMAGAAALCARACLKTGAGLTTVLCRPNVLPVVQLLAPGAVCLPLPEEGGRLAHEAADVAARALTGATSAVIGCGLGQEQELLPLLETFRRAPCPVVWDADALNLLAAHPALLPLPASAVITPHPGEAARLLGCETGSITADMPASLLRLQERCGCAVLLKGARTLMTDGSAVAVNHFGSPALARGGSGDILSGMLGALLARAHLCPGQTRLETLQLAALLHGLAGQRAAERFGEDHATAEDIIACIGAEKETAGGPLL